MLRMIVPGELPGELPSLNILTRLRCCFETKTCTQSQCVRSHTGPRLITLRNDDGGQVWTTGGQRMYYGMKLLALLGRFQSMSR